MLPCAAVNVTGPINGVSHCQVGGNIENVEQLINLVEVFKIIEMIPLAVWQVATIDWPLVSFGTATSRARACHCVSWPGKRASN